jgi:hypothetical protein
LRPSLPLRRGSSDDDDDDEQNGGDATELLPASRMSDGGGDDDRMIRPQILKKLKSQENLRSVQKDGDALQDQILPKNS